MAFITPSMLVMSSFHHHYLLQVTFTGSGFTNSTNYAGKNGACGSNHNYYRLKMRLENPSAVCFDGDRTLYLSLVKNQGSKSRILKIDTSSGQGDTVCSTSQRVGRLTYERFSNKVYFTSKYGFGFVLMDQGTSTVRNLIDGTGTGTGSLDSTGLYAALSFAQVEEKLWLICDTKNHR